MIIPIKIGSPSKIGKAKVLHAMRLSGSATIVTMLSDRSADIIGQRFDFY
jgi:hypothetical protein